MHNSSVSQYQENHPFFSVLILCWNSNPFIHTCLQSLEKQTFKNFEIILIENGSLDPVSMEDLKNFPNLVIKYFHLKSNIGFAAGNNLAATHAQGQYLALLNSDAFPQPDWMEVLYNAIECYHKCSFASKLIMANSPLVMDGEGDIYHASGIVWRKSFGHPVSQTAEVEKEVFSACGAAAVYPKHAFELVEGFDEDYFAYVEDVDLGFRLRLAGIPCIYLPSAVVHHIGSGSTSQRSDLSVYYGQRNLVWTFFKDMPGILFMLLLPIHLLMNFFMILLSGFRKQGQITIRAKRDALTGLGKFIKKRKKVQRQRKISIISLVKIIDWNPFSPLLKLLIKQ